MNKVEYKRRLREIGYDLDAFRAYHGLAANTWRNWGEVPVGYIYWLYWFEAKEKLRKIRELIDA